MPCCAPLLLCAAQVVLYHGSKQERQAIRAKRMPTGVWTCWQGTHPAVLCCADSQAAQAVTTRAAASTRTVAHLRHAAALQALPAWHTAVLPSACHVA